MAINKTPKLAALTAFGIGGWLLPLAYPMSTPVTSFSLMLSAFSSTALALEVQRESLVYSVANTEKKLDLERLAYEQSLRHQAELDRLREFYGFGDDDRYEEEQTPQPTLTGATIHQSRLPTSELQWHELEPNLIEYPALALVGPQGSGKTTLAQHLIRVKKAAGHDVVVLDPHYRKGEWEGCKVIGSGKNYKAIDTYLSEVFALIDARYRERETNGTDSFKPLTIVVEELTGWDGKVENAQEFIKASLSDFRKIGLKALFISHGDTNTLWGGGRGTRGLRDSSLAFIKPQVKLTPMGAKPLGKAQVCIPGSGSFTVDVPDFSVSPAQAPTPRQTSQGEIVEDSPTIALLDRTLAASPKPEAMHLEILDMARGNRNGIVSVRDVMRRLSIPTSQAVKELFYQLQSLEMGEIQNDRLPNGTERITFFAYPPMP